MTESTTAMDIVRQAQRGEISVDELIAALLEWEFEPSSVTFLVVYAYLPIANRQSSHFLSQAVYC